MINAAICDGDWVVIRQQNVAESGDIVAAMLDGEATVKTFKRVKNDVWLMPHNPMFEPIPGNDASFSARWSQSSASSDRRSSGRTSRPAPAPLDTSRPVWFHLGGTTPASCGASAIRAQRSDVQTAADDLLHDLVRAAVDLLDPRIEVRLRNRVFTHVAVTAVQLEAAVDELDLLVSSPVLGHRSFLHGEGTDVEQLDALVHEHPASRASVDNSASSNRLFWNLPIGLPKALRSRQYWIVSSRTCSIAAAATTAIDSRSCGRFCIR